MGGLFLTREEHLGDAEARMDVARAQFTRHGFTGLKERRFAGWALLHAPYIVGGPELFAQSGDDFAIAAGTLAYDGLTGPAALLKLRHEAETPRLDWNRLAGQFALILRTNLRPTNSLVKPRRTAYEDLDIFALRIRNHLLQQLLRDEPLAIRPLLRRVVQHVEATKPLGEFLLEFCKPIIFSSPQRSSLSQQHAVVRSKADVSRQPHRHAQTLNSVACLAEKVTLGIAAPAPDQWS